MGKINRRQAEAFFEHKHLALFGKSTSGKKFGNMVLKELQGKGFTVYPVHPSAEEIDGVACYSDPSTLPSNVDAAVLVIPPARTEEVVQTLGQTGIRHVWMQQGAVSHAAVNSCKEQGIDVIAGECVLMFAEPVTSIHRFHRWIWKLIGKIE